jgi:hypothetical protein
VSYDLNTSERSSRPHESQDQTRANEFNATIRTHCGWCASFLRSRHNAQGSSTRCSTNASQKTMVAPGRFELPTSGLGNRCSIHLSYGAVASKYFRFNTLQSFVQVSVLRCKRPFPKTSFAYATCSGQAAREGT